MQKITVCTLSMQKITVCTLYIFDLYYVCTWMTKIFYRKMVIKNLKNYSMEIFSKKNFPSIFHFHAEKAKFKFLSSNFRIF